MLTPLHHQRRAVQGFVLMDVLVSILLFSVGVLALVGLQAAMTRSQTESKVRADASYLASELLGQMWGDINSLSSYSTTGCASLARCKEWQDRVANSLPQGSGTVSTDASTGDVTVTISWTMPNGDQHQYVTQSTIVKAGG
ncbi:MAG TPA: pilus assembly protein PilV [Aquabacterium sp.]|nr:pilus assembly protein PilV [Aquabacterium sp.]